MVGKEGIISRVLKDLFSMRKNVKTSKFKISLSYIMIFNDEIFDLLSQTEKIPKKLKIKENNKR